MEYWMFYGGGITCLTVINTWTAPQTFSKILLAAMVSFFWRRSLQHWKIGQSFFQSKVSAGLAEFRFICGVIFIFSPGKVRVRDPRRSGSKGVFLLSFREMREMDSKGEKLAKLIVFFWWQNRFLFVLFLSLQCWILTFGGKCCSILQCFR